MTIVSSSRTGQRAFQQQLSDDTMSNIDISNIITQYAIPSHFICHSNTDVASNNSSSSISNGMGIPIYKVTKTGTLQLRRIGISLNRRQLVVSTNRSSTPTTSAKKVVKGLWKAAIKNVKGTGNKDVVNPSISSSTNTPSSSKNDNKSNVDDTGTQMKCISIHYIDRIVCSNSDNTNISSSSTTDYPMSERFMKYAFLSSNNNSVNQTNSDSTATSSATNIPNSTKVSTSSSSTTTTATVPYYPPSQCISIVYIVDSPLIHDNSSAMAASTTTTTTTKLETLDFIIPNTIDCRLFISILRDLLLYTQEEIQLYTYNMQCIKYYTTVCLQKDFVITNNDDKNNNSNKLSIQEFLILCDKLQVPVKKQVLQMLFKEQCKDYKSNDKLLIIPTIVSLLDKVRTIAATSSGEEIDHASQSTHHDPITVLWNELVRTDPVPLIGTVNDVHENLNSETTELGVLQDSQNSISSVALLSFIRSQQKNYTISLEEVTAFVRQYSKKISGETTTLSQQNPSTTISSQSLVDESGGSDRITKGRFISWLLSDSNDIVDPYSSQLGYDDMTRPLSHYYINTSHDTYLCSIPEMINSNNNNSKNIIKWKNDIVDVHQYMTALLRGVRCLEIDVWDDNYYHVPIVAFQQVSNHSSNKGFTSNFVPFSDVLKTIRCFLTQHPTSFPIIIKIENHCTTSYQLKMANMIYELLCVPKLLYTPPEFSQISKSLDIGKLQQQTLPSPESARGRVVILGKRPKQMKVGACTFINDDLDSNGWHMIDPIILKRYAAYESDDFLQNDDYNVPHRQTTIQDGSITDRPNTGTIVVGFDKEGPIYKKADNKTLRRSPAELYKMALLDSERASLEKDAAISLQADLIKKADVQEVLAAQCTQAAGMSPDEVKQRASKAAHRADGTRSERAISLEDKNSNDEGLEIHEILPDLVEDNQDAYAEAVQKSMEAGQLVNIRRAELLAAEQAQQRAESDLEMSRQLERIGIDNARKAAAEARVNQEYADAAYERIGKVRELFKNSTDSASSAGTVVQTAQTEATISKKRAADAEGRAARAQMTAERDRERADEETRKEEILEQEVSELHVSCQDATDATQAARVQLDKASAMFDRVTEQIKLIEKSTQYRKELAESHTDVSSVRHGGSFLAKHELKLEERNTCKELMKQAHEERASAEARLIALRSRFEEKARTWRVQANVALQARRTADRSAHIAEDLAEHAEEEREAAQLRQFAREKALEAVENRSSHRESVEAQLAEAERAATEAAEIAAQSRNRAQRLQQEVDKVGNHATFINLLEARKTAVSVAKLALEQALKEKQEYDELAEDEKRRLDTNSAVYRSAAREAVSDSNRMKAVQVLQQEAIVAYNTALMLRKQADAAIENAKEATANADNKKEAVKHAKEYKARMDMLIEMPVLLAKSTLLHSCKFINWERSHGSPCTVSHSFAQNILLEMIENENDQDRGHLNVFTRDHLCRVFPSWRAMAEQSSSANYDPVFAWSMGCQMVGMNYQSADENLLVADGRFRQNGSCGYVLKPRCLIDSKKVIEQQQQWTFRVLGAYNLPRIGRKVITPRVRVSLYGGSTTETRKMFKTKFARMNGINPSWDEGENVFNFVVVNPSIAMLSFSVWDKCGDKAEKFVAGSAFPISCIREGYRSIALFNIDHTRIGPMMYATLLVKVSRR